MNVNQFTPEELAKLPKWALQKIEALAWPYGWKTCALGAIEPPGPLRRPFFFEFLAKCRSRSNLRLVLSKIRLF